jgi:hypothetical protein
MKSRMVYLVLVPVCWCSCKPLYLKMNGIRKPEVETVESVTSGLSRFDRSYPDYLCIPKDSASFIRVLKALKHLPSASFFLEDGSLLKIQDTGYCAGIALNFAKILRSDTLLKVDSAVTFPELAKHLQKVGQRATLDTRGYDFTVVFLWLNFAGRANENNFLIRDELDRRFPGKVNYLFVNMDVQQTWHMVQMPYRGYSDRSRK